MAECLKYIQQRREMNFKKINIKKIDKAFKEFSDNQSFDHFICDEFLNFIQKRTSVENIFSDSGLNGAGWHIHNRGGMLNVHLDYNLHPNQAYRENII